MEGKERKRKMDGGRKQGRENEHRESPGENT